MSERDSNLIKEFLLVFRDSGCWHWPGSVNPKGYGYLTLAGMHHKAHRLAYELFVGPIPEGMTVDHLCHNEDLECPGGGPTCLHRRCVNPAHLDLATPLENRLRSNLTARRAANPNWVAPKRPRLSAPRLPRTECARGHALSEENTYQGPDGSRRCRECRRLGRHTYSQRRTASAA